MNQTHSASVSTGTTVIREQRRTGSSKPKKGTAISRSIWPCARVAGGAAILAVLVWRVGIGPLVDGLRLTTGWPLAAAFAITALTTLCCAVRWRLIAGRLGVEIPLRTAVAAYYRSQFLNATLPGGVMGDVHRAVRHGRDVGDLNLSLRAVAWERTSGFAVQLVLTVGVLLLLSWPAGSLVGPAAVVVAVVAGVVAVLLCLKGGRLASRIARAFTTDLRDAVLAPRAWPGILLASTVAVLGHVTVFVIAVRATGADVSPARLLPLALVVLTASAVPTNIAGWGPREGAAAWAFSSVGLGAAQGVTVAVVYGILALVATLPGAVVLVLARRPGLTSPRLRRSTAIRRPRCPDRAQRDPKRPEVDEPFQARRG
ncbi:YbhN family protein [Kribbella sp. NPDC004536]|uniref:lysylphosphatidylglycerol synthase transmembrane domain-containing protein n=1 Tax=Kribbella sp. NPDC004536 TaxID=3364106 RepID=UPI0036A78173